MSSFDLIVLPSASQATVPKGSSAVNSAIKPNFIVATSNLSQVKAVNRLGASIADSQRQETENFNQRAEAFNVCEEQIMA
jgi:hypothetical protein